MRIVQYLYDYLDAVITHQTSPDDAYAKFDAIAAAMIDELRQLTKKVNSTLDYCMSIHR